MSLSELPQEPIPLWVKVIIVVCCLPILAFPWLLSLCPEDSSAETFLWIYPLYVLVSGYLAWRCWTERPSLSWILLAVMLLTHAAMWLLVDPTIILP